MCLINYGGGTNLMSLVCARGNVDLHVFVVSMLVFRIVFDI